jgi:hypothetical protein
MDELEAILETSGAAAVEIAASALAERGGTVGKCANCGHPMIGPYCAVCGQPINTHRRTLGHLLHEFFKDVISFDSRILRTVRALLFEPGELAQAFRQGRTQRYMPALRLYLFVSLLFFLFLSATGIAFMQLSLNITTSQTVADKAGNVFLIKDGKRALMTGFKADAKGNVYLSRPGAPKVFVHGMKADTSTSDNNINNTVTTKARFFERIGAEHPKYSPEAKAALVKMRAEAVADEAKGNVNWLERAVFTTLQNLETNPAALNEPILKWVPRILFLLLPLFALLLAAFYRGQRKQFYFVDHLVFSLSMHTFAFVALIAAAGAAQIISDVWVAWLTAAVLALYLLLALKRFYGQSWIRTGLKFVAIGINYPLFFLGPALAAAVVASVLGA